MAKTWLFMEKIGMDPTRLRFRQHLKTVRLHPPTHPPAHPPVCYFFSPTHPQMTYSTSF